MAIVLLILFLIAILVCWIITLAGLPGNWVILLLAAGYDLVLPAAWHWKLGWPVLIVLLILAVAGEVFETMSGFWQNRKAGGSQRSAWLSLVGSIIGGIAGAIVAIPVPVIGSLIAAILGSMLGALAGGMAGQYWSEGNLGKSFRVGSAAAFGRLLGTVGKTLAGAIMVAILVIALVAGMLEPSRPDQATTRPAPVPSTCFGLEMASAAAWPVDRLSRVNRRRPGPRLPGGLPQI